MSAELDPYRRFDWGILPTSKGDYAFVMHMLHSLDELNGRMGIILPHGVLFRGQSEGKIRKAIIEQFNFLDAVIGLPANLFYGAGIPACILIFRKNRGAYDKVLFIDASGEGHYEKGKNQNVLREQDVKKIVETYQLYRTDINFKGEEKYSHVATLKEIKANEYNLNIPRYVDNFEEEELVDIEEVKKNIANIEVELAEVQAKMDEYLRELGI